MSKKKTLEEAYFHISNSGLTLKIVERIERREHKVYAPYQSSETQEELKKRLDTPLGVEQRINRRWYTEVRLAAFGSSVSFRFPLVPLIVEWLIEVLPRVHGHMTMPVKEPTDGIEYGFRDLRQAYIKHHEGREVDYRWPVRNEVQGEDCAQQDGPENPQNPQSAV